ncbi:MAG: large subunit ribosomal protein L23 [Gammaproteobacteria bacterium]
MNDERLMKVLVAPHVSEKSTRLNESANQVVFKVLPDARKLEIKHAVEKLFSVEVEEVQVTNVKGKRKGAGPRAGRRSDWKKAYVRLKQGHDIDFVGVE